MNTVHLHPFIQQERLQPAKKLALQRKHALVDFDHLLWVELHDRTEGILPAVLEKRGCYEEFLQGIKSYLEFSEHRPLAGEKNNIGYAIPLQKVIDDLAAKAAGDEPIAWARLLASILDYPEHRIVPLLRDLGLSGEDLKALQGSEFSFTSRGTAQPENGSVGVAGALQRLNAFGVDLTERARAGEIDEVIGRDEQIRQLAVVLARKRANNPLLLGEPGVGKTTIAEGLALRIIQGKVPQRVQNKHLFSLDLGLLVAGATYRGEFEQRLKTVLQALADVRGEIILFIDEIHQLLGLGQTAGAMDAANLMKPALDRGALWCIGATTFTEYKHFTKDPALQRRFQPVRVPEQSMREIRDILIRLAPVYERYHGVRYDKKALETILALAHRYTGEVSSPAREINLLDESGAESALEQSSTTNEERVTPDLVRATVARRTGIPVQRLTRDEKNKLRLLEQTLNASVFGQAKVIAEVTARVRRCMAGLGHPRRPRGVLFFAGASGVGKTETAKVLARELYDTPKAMIRIDMSEYGAETARNRLIGADPGYVGYEEGGYLTEAVRRRPYSLVLLDEFEKAHPSVWRMFLQVFDDGRLTDAQGRTVDFSNTLIVMTSNLGAHYLAALEHLRRAPECSHDEAEQIFQREIRKIPRLTLDIADILRIAYDASRRGKTASPQAAVDIVRQVLLTMPNFPPELLSRTGDPLVFGALDRAAIAGVLDQLLKNVCALLVFNRDKGQGMSETELAEQISVVDQGEYRRVAFIANSAQAPEIELRLAKMSVDYLLDHGFDPVTGVRKLRNLFESRVETALAEKLLDVEDGGAFRILLDPFGAGEKTTIVET